MRTALPLLRRVIVAIASVSLGMALGWGVYATGLGFPGMIAAVAAVFFVGERIRCRRAEGQTASNPG